MPNVAIKANGLISGSAKEKPRPWRFATSIWKPISAKWFTSSGPREAEKRLC